MNGTMNLLANETALAARAANEPAAFASIYDHYFPRIYNYVRYRVQDPDVTDELTSLIFERALVGIAGYRPEKAPLGAWLFGIARHAIENHYRVEKRRRWFSLDRFTHHAAPEPALEEVATQQDTSEGLLRAIAQLKEREKDLLALKFASGLDNGEIARLTGLSESNVGVSLYRAIRRLRTLLTEKEPSDE